MLNLLGPPIGKPFALLNKNGANTQVSSIVVKAGAGTLALNTDYNVFVGDGSNGTLGYTYIVPVTAQTLAITVNYSYTPNASQYTGLTVQNTKLPALVVRVTSLDESTGKTQVHYLINSSFNGEIVRKFVDVARAGEIGNSPFVFTANRKGQVLSYAE